MSFFVPTRFVWRFGGRQVHLCGSFTRWVETVPMALVEGSPGVFAVVVHLPPGYHQYKFIVDGKWRHDETAPFMPDPLGNVNNWLFVRRIESTPAPSPNASPLSYDQQQQFQQQQQQAAAATAAAAAAAAAATAAAAQQQQQYQSGQAAAAQVLHQVPPSPQTSQPYPSLQVHLPSTSSQRSGNLSASPSQGDEVMAEVSPVVIHNPKEPEFTRKKISDFLHSHSAYELIPESGKVVMLDVDLPVRQAFHALHDQGVASAPLWDSQEMAVIGVLSASDLIKILKRMRHSVRAGGNAMSEAEMDFHTIRGLREEATAEGHPPRQLIYVNPDDDLARVVSIIFTDKCSMTPVLAGNPGALSDVPSVLHLATLSAVLASLMRYFRASLGSLPLLGQPLGSLPLGTWSPDAGVAHTELLPEGSDRRQWRRLQPLQTVMLSTPLTTALSMLLEGGVSALPVVDDKRALIDIYARSDITQLCKGNAYNRLQWEDVTVGQALSLAQPGSTSWAQEPSRSATPSTAASAFAPSGVPMGGLSAEFAARDRQAAQDSAMMNSALAAGPHGGSAVGTRVFVCTKDDSLRTVVERLAIPGVRRLIVVHPDTRRVDGVISLSDVAGYLFL